MYNSQFLEACTAIALSNIKGHNTASRGQFPQAPPPLRLVVATITSDVGFRSREKATVRLPCC
jgi:hypothetical protein